MRSRARIQSIESHDLVDVLTMEPLDPSNALRLVKLAVIPGTFAEGDELELELDYGVPGQTVGEALLEAGVPSYQLPEEVPGPVVTDVAAAAVAEPCLDLDSPPSWVDVDGMKPATETTVERTTCPACNGHPVVHQHRPEGGSVSCRFCNRTFTFNIMRNPGPHVCGCRASREAACPTCLGEGTVAAAEPPIWGGEMYGNAERSAQTGWCLVDFRTYVTLHGPATWGECMKIAAEDAEVPITELWVADKESPQTIHGPRGNTGMSMASEQSLRHGL